MSVFRSCILAVASLLMIPALCLAHKVSLFASVEGDRVDGEAYFSGGTVVRDGSVRVLDNVTGEEYLVVQTDEQGFFSFTVPESAKKSETGLRLVLRAGEAHQNEWLIPPAELAGSLPGGAGGGPSAEDSTKPATRREKESVNVVSVVAGILLILAVGFAVSHIRSRRKRS